MANKFTGITSAGVNVPVYDKEAHQALGNVYTKSEVDTELNTKQDNLSTEQLYNIDHALTTSAGLMEESKLSINSNHITAYNGIPFSAQGGGGGGATYEGVAPIVVDNTENKISADTIDVNYQQIVHDDSLVHVSNNAQYALGVNTRMFPCDETVLWEGKASTGTITLSEPPVNFEYIALDSQDRFGWGGIRTVHSTEYISERYAQFVSYNFVADNTYIVRGNSISGTDNTSVAFTVSGFQIVGNSVTTSQEPKLLKVTGICRKA